MVVKNALGNETSPLLSSSPALNFGDHVESRSSLGSYHVNMVSSVRKLSSQFSSLIAYHTGTIGTFGSVSIAVNSLTGPAMLGLPALFARSGIIPTCCTVVVVAGLSSFCALHLANTISKVEGNSNFQKEIEYSTVFGFYLGPTWFNLTQVVFFFCILCLNVSSIVDTAQVVDTFFGNWWPWGGTAAININGDTVTFTRWDYSFCSEASRNDGLCSPFSQTEGSVLTLGNLVVTLFLLPLALLPLRESAWWQTLGFVILLLTSMQFIVTFLVSGLHMSEASWWGDDWDDLFGVILFNFALVIAVPAWLYEREPDVDVPSVVHGSCALSALLYILIGILGHMAIPNVNDNMLQSIMSGTLGVPLQLGATVFAFAIIGLGIPLFSVLTRMNLVGSGLCSERVANIFAVYLPFAMSCFLNDSGSITKLLSWGGMIFTSLIAFILPIILTLHVNKISDNKGSVAVYFGFSKENGAELLSLRILLFCAVSAILVAVIGNFV